MRSPPWRCHRLRRPTWPSGRLSRLLSGLALPHVRALGDDEAERFTTAALVNIPADGRAAVQLVNCGHLTPLAISRRGAC